jgi:hypothetical protein
MRGMGYKGGERRREGRKTKKGRSGRRGNGAEECERRKKK